MGSKITMLGEVAAASGCADGDQGDDTSDAMARPRHANCAVTYLSYDKDVTRYRSSAKHAVRNGHRCPKPTDRGSPSRTARRDLV